MPVRLTKQLKADGLGSPEIRRLVRDQQLYRLRRGAYSTELSDELQRHRQLIAATLPVLADGCVLSHTSAAVLHGLPVAARDLQRVTVTHPGKGGCLIAPALHRYRTPLAPSDTEVVDGLVRTTLPRTVIDLARCGDLAMAVAAADRALRVGLHREELLLQLDAAPRRRGIARARIVAQRADGLSESAGESCSRVLMWQLDLPMPELQLLVEVAGHRYRADFGWRNQRVLGEFDGKVKYELLLRDGETAADVVMREKRREADLRAAGWWVVRWTWSDLAQPERFERLISAALKGHR